MDNEHMIEFPEVPDEVDEVVRAAVRYLMGRGPAPDIDALAPHLRDMVDELLPTIIELVGDRIAAADDEGAGNWVAIGGRRLRQLREDADITPLELAARVSSRGKTIGSDVIYSFEAVLESRVDADLAQTIAESLGVGVEELSDGPGSIDRVVFADIHGTRPTVAVELDAKVLDPDIPAALRLVISDFGLAARLAVLDVSNEHELRSDDARGIARLLSDLDAGVTFVLLVAGRDPELGTQIFDSADLADAFQAPAGGRLAGPRRHPVALRDAVRFVFEEISAEWNDDEVEIGGAWDIDAADIASICAANAIADATKTTPRIKAKAEAVAAIDGDEVASLAALLVKVQQGRVTAGEPFRKAFEDDLVGAA